MHSLSQNTDYYINNLVANRYLVKKLIARGGMGSVYEAQDILSNKLLVAIKFLSQSISEQRLQQLFIQEARICTVLGSNSNHIVQVKDYGISTAAEPYYVMEYLRGESLKDFLQIQSLSLSQFVVITRQICLGLDSAHQGIEVNQKKYFIIHRDIKPANILITTDPQLGYLVKILDFGIAKFFSDNTYIDQTNAYIGTVTYSSPEQMDGSEIDCRSDIYSLGVMMFQMLTGKLPWQVQTQSFGAWYKVHQVIPPSSFKEVAPDLKIPKVLEDLVMACLAKSASDRPQQVKDIIQVLDSIQTRDETKRTNGSIKPTDLYNLETQKYESNQNPNKQLIKVEPTRDTISHVFQRIKEILRPDLKQQELEKNEQSFQTINPTFKTETSQQRVANIIYADLKNQLPVNLEEACWQSLWPHDKPISEIVFPNLVQASQQAMPSLWVMLPRTEIKKYLTSKKYNYFLCLISPHPMILWITAIYQPGYEPRWLSCFLDIKTYQGQKFSRLLAKVGYYPVLFFSMEKPRLCLNIIRFGIPNEQRKLLGNWLITSQDFKSSNQPQLSKRLLKAEYEKLKPKILEKLKNASDELSSTISYKN